MTIISNEAYATAIIKAAALCANDSCDNLSL